MLATISDKKFGVSSAGSSLIDHYEPDIVTAQDYYPFGMMSRVELQNSEKPYKFGFNGKLNDNDVKGGYGLQQDYGMRIYDPRVGRFLSVDPLTKDYPWYTSYQFAGNTPIQAIDLDGLEPFAPWKPEGWLYILWMELKHGDPTGSKSFIAGTQQQADVKERNMSYHNDNVPDAIQKRLDDVNTKEGTAKVVKGGAQLVEWTIDRSYDAASAVFPVDEALFSALREVGVLVDQAPLAEILANKTAERIMATTSNKKMPRTVTVILDKRTGKVYEGISGGVTNMDEVTPELKKLLPKKNKESWDVFNCSECDALNKAFKDKANAADLEMHTVQITKKTKTIENRPRCNNCKITAKGIKTTSDKK